MFSFFLLIQQFLKSFRRALNEPQFRGLFFLVGLLLVAGVTFYMHTENWSFVNALYFCVVALTTVGFGDLTPTHDSSKIFTIFYILFGIGIIVSFINLVAKHSLDGYHRRQAEFEEHIARKKRRENK